MDDAMDALPMNDLLYQLGRATGRYECLAELLPVIHQSFLHQTYQDLSAFLDTKVAEYRKESERIQQQFSRQQGEQEANGAHADSPNPL